MIPDIKLSRRLSFILITLIWISIVLNFLLFIGSSISDFFYVPDLEDEDNTGGHIFFVLLMWTFVFLTIVLLWLAELVAFLVWFGRFYGNLYKQRAGLEVTPRWAVVSFLIPGYNAVAPLLIMSNMFRTINSLLESSGNAERLSVGRLRVWWAFVVAEALLVITIFVLSFTKCAPDLLLRVQFITIICSTVAAFMCIRFVKVCTRMETLLIGICRKRGVC